MDKFFISLLFFFVISALSTSAATSSDPVSPIYQESLQYHQFPEPGKLDTIPSKPLNNAHDLSLAYSPGVAAASSLIAKDPKSIRLVTGKANLVAVISNGTAVLGLGNIGPEAAKPVMEGKAVLFKKFAGLNSFDIEIRETNPDDVVKIVAALEPTFGGINLEDFKAPECFYIEKKLKERLHIPVIHDDQHGTAIVVSAALINSLELLHRNIKDIKLVMSGAGAAAIPTLDLLIALGLNPKNIILCDSKGVIYKGRSENMNPEKERFARETSARTLSEALVDADVFIGLSAAKIVTPDMIKSMSARPIVFALANPEPEIRPELIKKVKPTAIIATGRSDYPNQVNNALAFPYLFRGALDVGASTINQAMEIACVNALVKLTKAKDNQIVAPYYDGKIFNFGPDYIIPKPLDPRLLTEVSPAIAEAAMKSGLAAYPIKDWTTYRQTLLARMTPVSP
jgi:malate dehydrogenase (oxaloacetate-decarboxylating)(NADP+)